LKHWIGSSKAPRGSARKLAGRADEWRLRVGDWRIRYKRDPTRRSIIVLRVLRAAKLIEIDLGHRLSLAYVNSLSNAARSLSLESGASFLATR